MSLPEACSVWIEQRVQEELDAKGETGASLRAIGRTVAAEVEKYFETKVSPTTISMKASRMNTVTNVTPKENPTESTTNPNLEKLEKTHGGLREGSGRKPSPEPETTHTPTEEVPPSTEIPKEGLTPKPRKRNKPAVRDERITDNFQKAYDKIFWAIKEERDDGWSKMTKESALRRVDSLVQILTYGK